MSYCSSSSCEKRFRVSVEVHHSTQNFSTFYLTWRILWIWIDEVGWRTFSSTWKSTITRRSWSTSTWHVDCWVDKRRDWIDKYWTNLLDAKGDNDGDVAICLCKQQKDQNILSRSLSECSIWLRAADFVDWIQCQMATCNRDATDVKSTEVENFCAENSKKGFWNP